MSRKSKRNARPPQGAAAAIPVPAAAAPAARAPGRAGRVAAIVIAAATLVIVAALVAKLVAAPGPEAKAGRAAALASAEAPSVGAPDARVHIVEFIDPACETCALFYPEVKKLMAENPGKIRLSIRHVAFHKGADAAVRALEGARAQGRYFQALEALLANQRAWVENHRVVPERIDSALSPSGVDVQRLERDILAPEVARRMEGDLADARALGVSQTPEYFVNGRQMREFGLEELRALVHEEIARAYR